MEKFLRYNTKQSIFGFPKSVIPILKIRTGRLALIGCSLNRRYTHDRRIIKIIDKPSASKTHVVYIQLRSRRSDRASLHARSNNRPCSVFLKKAREKSIGEIIICHRSSRGVSRNRLDPACKKVDVPTTVGGGNWLVKKRKEGGEKGKKERNLGGEEEEILVEADHADDRPVDDRLLIVHSRVLFIQTVVAALCSDISSLEKAPAIVKEEESCRRVVTRRQVPRRTPSTRAVTSRMEATWRRSLRSQLSLKKGTTDRLVTHYPRTLTISTWGILTSQLLITTRTEVRLENIFLENI